MLCVTVDVDRSVNLSYNIPTPSSQVKKRGGQ